MFVTCICTSYDFIKFRCIVQIKLQQTAECLLMMTAESGDAMKLVERCRYMILLRNLNTRLNYLVYM